MNVLSKSKKIIVSIMAVFAVLCFSLFAYTSAMADRITPQTPKVAIYQLAPENGSLMESYVIKTVNGKLIVIDGGIDGAGDNVGLSAKPYLPSALRAIAGVDEGEYFEVEAWFISHAHSDHFFELAKMLDAYNEDPRFTGTDTDNDGTNNYEWEADTNYKINNFYFDFPTDLSKIPAKDYSEFSVQMFKDGLENYATVNEIEYTGDTYYDFLNAKTINKTAISTGLNITIDGVRFDILQTWDESDGQVNSNSTVMKMWFEGQSVLFLNDATVESGLRLLNTYGGEFLKSDIVQMAHHGQSGCNKEFYDAIDAKNSVRLWSASRFVQAMATTKEVCSWLGMSETPTANTAKDIFACHYSAYPAEKESVSSWAEVVDGMKIDFPYVGVYASDFYMQDGAEMRTTEGSNGLRFKATLTSYDPTGEYGFVIVPKDYIVDNEITSDYVNQLNTIYGAENIINIFCKPVPVSAAFEMKGSIANIKYDNVNREFVGIAYELLNGVYTYAEFDSLDDISRSIGSVAVKAYNNHYYDNNQELYDTDELAVIEGFVTKSLNKKAGAEEGATPDTSMAFSKTNYELTWGETDTYSLNTLFDESDIKWEVTDDSVVVLDNGTIRTVGVGETTITAKCYGNTSSVNVKVNIADGYSATMENDGYIGLVHKDTADANHAKATVNVSRVENFEGVESAIKIEVSNTGWSKVFLDLPKAHSGKYTVKYYFSYEGTAPNYFRINNVVGTVNSDTEISGANLNAIMNSWQESTYNATTGIKDQLNFQVVEAGGTEYKAILYIAYVIDTDVMNALKVGALANGLTDGYLADMTSGDYSVTISKNPRIYREARAVDAVEVASYTDANLETVQNVLKVTATASSGGVADFIMKLPKGAPTTGLTLKMCIASTTATAIYFRGPNANNTDAAERTTKPERPGASAAALAPKKNLWKIYHIDYTQQVDNDVLEVLIAGAGNGGATIIYIAWVMEGDTRATTDVATGLSKMKAELTDDYVATYDSADYVATVSNDATYPTANYEVTQLSTFEGENGVLKVAVADDGWGRLYFKLPKEHCGMYKVKYYLEKVVEDEVEQSAPSYLRINFKSGKDAEYSGATINSRFGTWTEDSLTAQTGDNGTINFMFTGSGTFKFNLYISYVKDNNAIVNALPAGHVASFDSEAYLDFVETTSGITTFNKEILETYDGETGVLKVTVKGNGWMKWQVNLPKEHSGKYIIKFKLEKLVEGETTLTNPNYFRFNCPSGGGTSDSDTEYANAPCQALFADDATWTTTTLTSLKCGNGSINFMTYVGGDNGYVMYISYVMDGAVESVLASKLAEGYYADFSDSRYANLVSCPDSSATIKSAEVLPSYQGETNVLKIVVEDNTATCFFNIKLPKAHTGTYNIKFWYATKVNDSDETEITCPNAFMIIDAETKADAYSIGGKATKNAWNDVTITSSASDVIPFKTWTSGAKGTMVLYISYVKVPA